nr:hypothetical protein DA06_03560 [Georgenia sp. SUBG003]
MRRRRKRVETVLATDTSFVFSSNQYSVSRVGASLARRSSTDSTAVPWTTARGDSASMPGTLARSTGRGGVGVLHP